MKAIRFTRNVWLLRRDLAARFLRRRAKPPKTDAIICIRCGRPLTAPCKPLSPCHVFRLPEGAPIKVGNELAYPGDYVYVRRQKTRGGQLRPDYELRLKPF